MCEEVSYWIYKLEILYPFHSLSFHFIDSFLCYIEAFQFDVVLFIFLLFLHSFTYLFLFWLLCFWSHIQIIITKTNVSEFFCMFSFKNFTVSAFIFNSLICFKFTFQSGIRGPILFFCMCISSSFSTIYWRIYAFPIVCSWHHCQRVIGHICVALILGSLFCSIVLCASF